MKPKKDVARAIQDFLLALGCSLEGDLRKTPERVATLWTEHLLWGESHTNTDEKPSKGTPSRSTSPVCMRNIGVHLVCPHHLTVAFGHAHVAYIPNGHVLGLKSIAHVVKACTARLVLQEDATQAIADTLVRELGVKAAVATLDAVHPCHNVPHGRSHDAHVCSWGMRGTAHHTQQLQSVIVSHAAKKRSKKSAK